MEHAQLLDLDSRVKSSKLGDESINVAGHLVSFNQGTSAVAFKVRRIQGAPTKKRVELVSNLSIRGNTPSMESTAPDLALDLASSSQPLLSHVLSNRRP